MVQEGDSLNTIEKDDVRDIALKLNEIYENAPEDYCYIKGVIHGLMQRKQKSLVNEITSKQTENEE